MHERSFKHLLKEQDPAVISLWQTGIILTQPEKIEQAIARGIDVNTPYNEHAFESAIAKLLTGYIFLYGDEVTDQQKIARREKLPQMVRMILNEGPDLTSKNSRGTCDLDRVMTESSDHSLAAEVVIHGLLHAAQQGHDLYKPDIGHLFTRPQTREMMDYKRKHNRDIMIAVHEAVRAKLANPSGIVEQALVKDHADKLGYWMTPLDMPSLADLPKPSDEAVNALEQAFAAAMKIDLVARDFAKSGDPFDAGVMSRQTDIAKRHLIDARRVSEPKPKQA